MATQTDFEIVIDAKTPGGKLGVELWRYRELFAFLAWRDLLVRYKQTAVGVAWSLLRPLLTMLIFTFVFGKLAKLPSEGLPYPVFVLAALLPWQLFANALTESSASLISNTNLITKVYFPRLIIPTSVVITALVDFLIAFALLIGMMAFYQVWPGWRILALPAFLAMALLVSLGCGLWLAALNVKYRDFRFVVPFLVQIGTYASPVGFTSDIVPEKWRLLYSANPMVGVIDGFRWALLGGPSTLHLPGLAISTALALALAVSGVWFFRRTERTFADFI